MRFQVENRGSVMKIDPQVPHVIISIADNVERTLDVPSNDFTLDVLHLFFEDTDTPGPNGFTTEHASRILKFWEHYRDKAQLVVAHCDAGQCRSPAVLAALQLIHENDDSHWFATRRPNRLVYRTILEKANERNLIG